MKQVKLETDLQKEIQKFITIGFSLSFEKDKEYLLTNPVWRRLKDIGTELWLDSGNIGDIQQLWTNEFSAVTVNNTLLNKEVQTGVYDSLIPKAVHMLETYQFLSEQQKILEMAFILNAWHGLRLVEKFDAHVSVEEHTILAHDVDLAVEYAQRFYAVCPERFIIKIPLTPAGLLATRRLEARGIPINHTLGFSARQNYVIARIGRPAYVNVFLGRLNSFVIENQLGNGNYVGEKAVLASQKAVKQLREAGKTVSRQIGASFRAGQQVKDLAGIDIMTMPPGVASQFLSEVRDPEEIRDRSAENYVPGLNKDIDPETVRLETLWDIDEKLISCMDAIDKENLEDFTPDDLVLFFKDHGCGDILVKWSDSEVTTSKREGKIPDIDNWRDALASKSIGLDSLMNLAGLNSFTTDQEEMDNRVRGVWKKTEKKGAE